MILGKNTKKHHREIPVFSAVCVILAVTVAIAAIFIFMFSNQNRIIESNKEFLRESSEQLTSRINVRLNNSIDKIVILSQSMGLHLNSTEFDDSFKEHLKNIRNIVEGSLFDYIEFADVNGINHNVTGGTSKANDREYFIEAMKGKSGFSYVCDSRATHETLVSFYAPVYSNSKAAGSLIGIFKAKSRLQSSLEYSFFNVPANSYLVDSQGVIIASSTSIDTTKSVNIKDILNIDVSDLNLSSKTYVLPLAENDVGVSVSKLNNRDWFVLTEFPQAVTEKMIRKSNKLVILLAVIMIAVFILILMLSVKVIKDEKKFFIKKNSEIEDALLKARLANEELTSHKSTLEEVKDVIVSSGLGVWRIELFEGQAPRMFADEKMKNLLGLEDQNLTPEEVYTGWFNNIVPDSLQSVLDSVDKMKSGRRDENTYVWNHPVYGLRYVRCGGSAKKTGENSFILRGYHYDVTELVLKEKKLIKQSNTDMLTQLLNRTAYETDFEILDSCPLESDFVYVSMDVNGLKTVNDNIGHEAGDELIKGATECMKKAFSEVGKIYRIGGDEFVAMLNMPLDKVDEKLSEFESITSKWSGKLIDKITVSYGAVKADEVDVNTSMHQISKIADTRMYDNKSRYYAKSNIDRGGQNFVINALSKMYVKILKINLSHDSYQIVHIDSGEKDLYMDESGRISQWFNKISDCGSIHEDDLKLYKDNLNAVNVKRFFENGNKHFTLSYRRKFKDRFARVFLEIIPANEYSKDNQTMYLYLKRIDDI